MLALGRVFYLIILLVVDPDFWGFTGCAVVEVFCRFLAWFLRGVCWVTISRSLTCALCGFQLQVQMVS